MRPSDAAEAVAAAAHVRATAGEQHSFAFEERALTEAGTAGKQDFPALAEHSLPGNPPRVGISESPCNLSCRPGVPGRPRHIAVSCDLATRDSKHCLLNLLEITQAAAPFSHAGARVQPPMRSLRAQACARPGGACIARSGGARPLDPCHCTRFRSGRCSYRGSKRAEK